MSSRQALAPVILRHCAVAGVALWIGQAAAGQLGTLRVYSTLGEPLDAEIELLSLPDPGAFSARIASVEAYRAANLRYDPRLERAQVSLKRGRDGRLYLRATTRDALDVPAVELLVEVATAHEKSTTRYRVPMKGDGPATAIAPMPAVVAGVVPAPAHDVSPPVASAATPAADIAPAVSEPGRPPEVAAAASEATPAPETAPGAAPSPGAPAPAPVAAATTTPPQTPPPQAPSGAPPEKPERKPELRDTLPGTERALPVVPQPRPDERPLPGHKRVLMVPRTAVKPVVDGALDDAAWKSAAVSDHFWIPEQQRWPSEQTEVLVMADKEYLYFGFRVYDRRPEAIQALQTRRGAGLGLDDQVGVELDPFLSFREISTYSVNANGVQDDAIAGGRARQLTWKGDWFAAAVRTPYGWSAEIAIPFSILNFEEGATSAAVNFLRYHHRTAEWSRWADITVRGLPEEMGRLTGLELPVVARTQPWTFMPHVIAGRNIPDKEGRIRDTLVSAGAELRYQPRPNLTGVLSLNPDFSQIESAITNINFNYNEKFRSDPRPFFQEGSAYFGNTRGYFYSNRIPDFDVGAKFFTRTSGYQVGALATRAPFDRTDYVLRAERELDATHSIGGMLVSTERPDVRNALYVVRGQGREASGLNYSIDAATTSTDKQVGDGSRFAGALGWSRDHWSLGVAADRYSVNYRPLNALLDRDLPGTQGYVPYVSYFRDIAEGPLREVRGDVTYTDRQTLDGRLQRRIWYAGGTVETRQQIRLGAWYSDGKYRPVAGAPGAWSPTLNHDYYWTGAIDLNTRSSWIGAGGSYSAGMLGGGEYEYGNVYLWVRPTRTTFVNVTAERLLNFGEFTQTVISGGWDITPNQTIVGRYINAFYGEAYRLAYNIHVRRNIDIFIVYDHEPLLPARLSAKLLMTFQ